MFGSLLWFELRGHLRRPSTWFYFGILFVWALAAASSEFIPGSGGLVRLNSAFSLTQAYTTIVMFGQVITCALVGTAILRDFDVRVHELLFTTRLTRGGYLSAKFLAAFAAMLVVYFALPVGALVASVMPWTDADSLVPIKLWNYVQPFLMLVVPTVLLFSALFFVVGTVTRNQFVIYTTGFLMLLGYSLGERLAATLNNDQLASLIDPFGIRPFELLTRYWTVAEKNAQIVPLTGFLLNNRLLWVGIAAALIAVAFLTVRLEKEPRRLRRARRAEKPAETRIVTRFAMPILSQRFDGRAAVTAWWSVTRFHARELLRSVPFLAIAAIGLINAITNCIYADQRVGTSTWPLSYLMAESAVGDARWFIILLLTVYSGELVWRERQVDVAQVLDASPVRSASVLLGKFTALLAVLAVFELCAIAGGMAVQIFKGYPHIDVAVYLVQAFVVDFPRYFVFVALAFLVQSLVPRKAIGHVVVILVYLTSLVFRGLGWDHRLYQVGSGVHFKYSDLNGYGPYPPEWLPVHGYSAAVAVCIVVLTYLFWVRGVEVGARLRVARERFRTRARVILGGALVSATALGGFIFYNTNILHEYVPRQEGLRRQAAYERRYKPFGKVNQPRVVAVDLSVDLYPAETRMTAGGTLTLVNRHEVPVDTMYVGVSGSNNGRVAWDTLEFDRAAVRVISDSVNGVYIFRLATPLAAHDTLHLRYRLSYSERGFSNSGFDNTLVENGTFISRDVFPRIGYTGSGEISGDNDRKKQNLPPRDRVAAITDTAKWQEPLFFTGAEFVQFTAVVSTSADQIAIAPGYLQREWREGDRRYFAYAMDAPIPDLYAVLSARWTVTKDTWHGVAIEVYHHATHTFNVPRMIEAAKAALAYYTTQFGAYQHRQVRILEFPRYQSFAQSFPNTIPYSEGIGFIARVDSTSAEDLDYPFFVTAHEIAHQWFPYQRMPANVQGAQALSEALSEYAALAVLDERYGPEHTQKFLRFELDGYLRGRGAETRREMPLMLVENQGYIQYQKGSLAFFALRDLIGANALNGALRAYLDEGRFAGPPYATTLDLMKHLRAATPDSLQYALHDLFETITLWDLRTDSATATRQPDGRWKVRLVVAATKLRADSLGRETAIPMADYVDVGVFGVPAPGNRLGRRLEVRKVRITKPVEVFEFTVRERPLRAGIDPYNRLIDRNPGDNSKNVSGG